MAHFRATCKGHRGEASRLGTKSSGLQVTCNGWELGASIFASYNNHLQSDIIKVNLTDGSANRHSYGTLSFTLVDGKLRILQSDFPELLI